MSLTPSRRLSEPPNAAASGAHASGVMAAPRHRLSDALVEVLDRLGVDAAFGLMGGSVVPLFDAIARSSLRLVHCRHEAGAAFAAAESYFASGRPAAVFATTGPGISNALTGLSAARWEGAKLVFLAGVTSAPHRGRWAFQETSPHTVAGFFTKGPLFHYATTLESSEELDEVASRLAAGLARPGGFVAGIAVPVDLQTASVRRSVRGRHALIGPIGCDPAAAKAAAELLEQGPFAIWAGFGARDAAAELRALAERTGAPVLSTPRGKGIFPEDHPLFLGVTGLGGSPRLAARLARNPPQRILVLGTKLGEFSSFWDPALVPPNGFVHVDIDPDVPGSAYPSATTYAVHADVRSFLRALDAALGRPAVVPLRPREPEPLPLAPRSFGRVRPSVLLDAMQRHVVERSDAVVLAEAGASFAWATHVLRFREPGRYRVSVGYGSMGHAAGGVLGAALGRRGKAVALLGDGAMLMMNELSTAVAHGAQAVWVILNDARYGMTHQGMQSLGFEPACMELPPTDFVMMARSMGADGVRVERETELEAALEAAMGAAGPFVVDVAIDRTERCPMGARIEQLAGQWSDRGGSR